MKTDCRIPRPIQLVIDDVGWRDGWDLSASHGPYRAGVDRQLGPADYHAIVRLGETLGIRPQCAMILREWDQENICATCPTATPEGKLWNNRHRLGPWLEESAAIFRTHAGNIEFAMHGVGHEHWQDGKMTRAEWFGNGLHERWETAVLEQHAECFQHIMRQNSISGGETDLPNSFVPCAFHFLWNNNDPKSSGAFLGRHGIRYASTPFSSCTFVADEPLLPSGGFEHDLLVLDRGNSKVPWHVWDTIPAELPATSICGIHWPNLLRPNPDENNIAVERWLEYLGEIGQDPALMLARNMAETASQWLHYHFTTIKAEKNGWLLDFSAIPQRARELKLVAPLILKFNHRVNLHSPDADLVASWIENDQFYLLLQPQAESACLRVSESPTRIPIVRNDTFDVLELKTTGENLHILLRVYGTQEIHLNLAGTPRVSSCSGARLLSSGKTCSGIWSCRLQTDSIFGREVRLQLQHNEQEK